MQERITENGQCLFGLQKIKTTSLGMPVQFPVYSILFIPQGRGFYQADLTRVLFNGPVVLFGSPLQALQMSSDAPQDVYMLQFDSDFYCIENHREEVACNRLLFNSAYVPPAVHLSARDAQGFAELMMQIEAAFAVGEPADIVLRAYLQLILAKASAIQATAISGEERQVQKDHRMEQFRHLLDKHYVTLHKPNEYARLLTMSPNNFTHCCKRYFKKSPTELIQERLILEAKRQLQMTSKSIKEIAWALQFRDEFYFSRFFKNFTNVSPSVFRKMAGVSAVAGLCA
ncbi:helix-turn-helix domain-containing protein [Deminuibacter soli]|uniref:AraC family transcriptional regulator n=1 Tax=Deminuibacter soli TaxID=2291815 RepID=A0A3E1NDE3_9BACT|nr:helix-turn-helix transcriptional regulator [Deminuibacter soli]RFM25778.1 AraC family transcriptional regulator [Deminuibacter soli]